MDPSLSGARELLPGLWRLRLPWSWSGVDHVNAYLLREGDDTMLVDCGPAGHPSCLAALEAALAQAGTTVEAITGLVLTHAHSDHVGQGCEIVRRSGAPVWRHRGTEHVDAVLRDPDRIAMLRGRRAPAEGVPAHECGWFEDVREEVETIGAPLPADHALTNGLSVRSPLGPLEVLHTPGHAPSQVALVQREQGFAIIGDSLCAVFAPYCDYGYSNDPVGELIATFDRIEPLVDLPLVLPGHGGPLRDPGAVLVDHRSGIDAGIATVRAALTEAPGGAYDVGRRALGPASTAVATFRRTIMVAGYLRHLRVCGEARRWTGHDGRFRHEPIS